MNEYDEYFKYLCEKVGITSDTNSYTILANELYHREFYFYSSEDSNIYEWALYLRYPKFQDIAYPCSVLEVLVALAEQWEHNYGYDSEYGDRTSIWFMEMLENVGLTSYSDDKWSYDSLPAVDDIITRLLDRQYTSNGVGGLFPLNFSVPGLDVRDLGLSDQLAHYINEKYFQIW